MTNTHFEEQLGSFINGDPKEQYSAYRKLISAREHNKASKNKQFQVGLERLYAAVGDTRLNELDRLLALATIGRIAATIKSQTKKFTSDYQNCWSILCLYNNYSKKLMTEPISVKSARLYCPTGLYLMPQKLLWSKIPGSKQGRPLCRFCSMPVLTWRQSRFLVG